MGASIPIGTLLAMCISRWISGRVVHIFHTTYQRVQLYLSLYLELSTVVHKSTKGYPQVSTAFENRLCNPVVPQVYQLGSLVCRKGIGLTQVPLTAISQWRCGPVERPVLPLNPMMSPPNTNSPATPYRATTQ